MLTIGTVCQCLAAHVGTGRNAVQEMVFHEDSMGSIGQGVIIGLL
jgi:hypothetical protein